ncbi:rod shape-determining protein [candidate division WWE3 bacterium CG10_big_fil_rev_8_21_14_0_10_32_10]|uniref:Cell shape-determining protein MreB n=1 Tax=candidate division WWE3 bacterium CG10_big_fil_rev_8_21_14_0_10_32_10 TaxID=1975090 RepID=A0A2H0R9K3_UNCKA|nr:MAG: rod shape-determining protein [candidate division WWE3 bacterium CG10_big_fil_rev_8_21_14_0_10_32_10]
MNFFSPKIGIDLGTVNCLVCNDQKEILLNEPSIVAIIKETQEIMAVGKDALEMLGKTPENIEAIRPLFNGAIANYTITEQMLAYFITSSLGRVRIIKPDVAVSIPSGSTSVEYRAVLDALNSAGAKNGYLVPESLAAAIGAELPVFSPTGNMIVNSGGGTTEVAVVSLGGLVSYNSVRTAGNKLDDSIVNYIRKKHNLLIGPSTAEKIKIKIGSAVKVTENKQKNVQVRGRDNASGMPKNIVFTTNEVVEAIEIPLKEMINGIKSVLENTSPELSSDILDKGMVLSGGTALLPGLDDYITQSTGIPAIKAEEPLYCVINGLGIILNNLKYFERSLIK